MFNLLVANFVSSSGSVPGDDRPGASLASSRISPLQKLLQDQGAVSLFVAGGVDERDRLLLRDVLQERQEVAWPFNSAR